MDEQMAFAWEALVMGMGTVFVGLVVLLCAMRLTGLVLNRRLQPASQAAGGADFSKVQLSEPLAPVATASDEGLPFSEGVIAAIAMALHLDRLALEELEAQRLTWTRMFKPFSPWLMDSKNSLHTHRIRYRATSATGTIVRDSAGRN